MSFIVHDKFVLIAEETVEKLSVSENIKLFASQELCCDCCLAVDMRCTAQVTILKRISSCRDCNQKTAFFCQFFQGLPGEQSVSLSEVISVPGQPIA